MKTLRSIFGNVWVLLGLAAFAVSLTILWRNPGFSREDAISGIIILGVVFPLLAWVTTLRARPLALTVRQSSAEMWLIYACVVGVTLYLIWGAALSDALVPADWLASPRGKFFVVLVRKLIVFVAIPFALFRILFGYRWRDFGVQSAGLRALTGNHFLVVLVLSGVILVFQYFAGTGAAPIRRGEFSAGQLALGLPLCFAWLFVEVGLVEEFFFRGLLQMRLAAWFKSEISGVALMALLFWSRACSGVHLAARRVGGCNWRESVASGCHCLRDRRALDQRNLFRDRLGTHEEFIRGDVPPCRHRFVAESEAVHFNLGYLAGGRRTEVRDRLRFKKHAG